jgi:CRP-like cAMP-binding protein
MEIMKDFLINLVRQVLWFDRRGEWFYATSGVMIEALELLEKANISESQKILISIEVAMSEEDNFLAILFSSFLNKDHSPKAWYLAAQSLMDRLESFQTAKAMRLVAASLHRPLCRWTIECLMKSGREEEITANLIEGAK